MGIIDPRLKFISERAKEELPELETTERFAVEARDIPSPKVKILLRFSGDLAKIEKAGFKPRTVAGDIVSGTIELAKVNKVAALANVIMIESSRPMRRELDVAIPEIQADDVHSTPPGYRGSGVIMGIIDSGIDFTHDCFRGTGGTSRILAIWDQWLSPNSSESHPTGYNYGVEYTTTDINAAIVAADPHSVVRTRDYDLYEPGIRYGYGHGTHVTGIAAGDGSIAGNGQPAFTFVGVAPEADIIVVTYNAGSDALGDSSNTLDAINYIFSKAASLSKPAVINISQGDNLGPHDGTSLLEQGIDNLLGASGKAIVKSAGNEGDNGRHASGTITQGNTTVVQFSIPSGDTSPDTIDIWYSGTDSFGITLTPPSGTPTTMVNPGTTTTINLPNGNSAFIDSVTNDPNNNDNRIYIQLLRNTSTAIQQGTWSFNLNGTVVNNGHFDAWIERGGIVPTFLGPHQNNARTISIPGTSDEIITVGSYITMGGGIGNISSFSSRGPTRDGRQKPDIAAPGEWVMSATSKDAHYPSITTPYHLLCGTSMSAPLVAGTIALMLQKNSSLTQQQIKNCIVNNAITDVFTGSTPNNTFGHGKLDALAAFHCAAVSLRPVTPVCSLFRSELCYFTIQTPTCGIISKITTTCGIVSKQISTCGKFKREIPPGCYFKKIIPCQFKLEADPGCRFIREPIGCGPVSKIAGPTTCTATNIVPVCGLVGTEPGGGCGPISNIVAGPACSTLSNIVPVCGLVGTEPGGGCGPVSNIVAGPACATSSMVFGGRGCGPVSMIAGTGIVTTLDPGILKNRVLVTVDPTVLTHLGPETYTIIDPRSVGIVPEEVEAQQHFTQLTTKEEETGVASYGLEWENLFDKGNERGY